MTTHSYFVVMCDLGWLGLEAVVHPETTRREVVSRIRSGEYKDISFIHHVVTGEVPEDVTLELMAEANRPDLMGLHDETVARLNKWFS